MTLHLPTHPPTAAGREHSPAWLIFSPLAHTPPLFIPLKSNLFSTPSPPDSPPLWPQKGRVEEADLQADGWGLPNNAASGQLCDLRESAQPL